jgi:fucose permease
MKKQIDLIKLLPILFGFFVMGFVDVVNISVSYVKTDFSLNDKSANLLPMMVFLWFAVFSLPTGIVMSKLGRRKTVLLSIGITAVAMMIPLFTYSFPSVLLAFALMGIGNTVIQVALPPLVTDVVPEKRITGMLTFGYFVKAISSFFGPVIVGIAVSVFGNWKLIFPVYACIALLSLIWLTMVPIRESETTRESAEKKIFSLLKNKSILILFSIILLSVGFEVGLMTATPKYLLERCSMPLEKGGLGCSLFYATKTIGTFIGAILLAKVSSRKFLIVTVAAAIATFIVMMLSNDSYIIMACILVLGLTSANIFTVALSSALRTDPSKANEISALMITGIAGGALAPPFMGIIADASNQLISLLVPLAALAYILVAAVYAVKK